MLLTWRYALQSLSYSKTSPENRNHSQAFGCCQPCLPCMTDLVLPRLQTRQQSLSGTFSIKTHNRYISTLSNTLYKSYRVHSALLLRCIGIGCSRMALVGGTQMAADVTGLLQRMLPRLDDTHLAVCIAVSKLGLTPPPDESAVVTFSIQTHNRCCPKLSNTLYQSYRVHGALLLGCVGVGCSRMALVGCTQMATDTTGLLQRMLPRLDATHLAVCIAVSKLFENITGE